MRDVSAILEPQSIAVIGATSREGTVAFGVMENLVKNGFTGKIYPINPKREELMGLKCYPKVTDVPDPIDLAVMIIPPHRVIEAVKECGAKCVRGLIVITAGFREVGAEGAAIEEEMVRVASSFNIPIIGPNCLGVINADPAYRMSASFAHVMPKAGNVGFISQSGAMGTAVLDYAIGSGLGFSKVISFGNKSDLNEIDMLMALRDDPNTDVIMMYLEDISNGQQFIATTREITSELDKPKPIILIKSGRTKQGAKAASSHTGSLAGSDEVYNAICAQGGVIRVNNIEELFALSTAFSYMPIPKGRRIGIVTNAGGPGILATDACVKNGLEVPTVSEATITALQPHLPPMANFKNPIDVIGDAHSDRYEHAIEEILKDPIIDAVLVLLTPQSMTEVEKTASAIVRLAQTTTKPILTSFLGQGSVMPGVKILQENNIPHYMYPDAAAVALAAMAQFYEWLHRPRTYVKSFKVDKKRASAAIKVAKADGRTFLPELESTEVLNAYGFPTLKSGLARDEEEAVKLYQSIDRAVVMKIVSPDIVHKFDVGGVKLNLTSVKDIREAFQAIMKNVKVAMPDARIWGVNVQEMAGHGREVIVGMKRDAKFGPLIMFGLGGIYVEVFKDVTFRLAPMRELSAECMVAQIKAAKVLSSFRGQSEADLAIIKECIERLAQLAHDFSDIEEMDINPLIVYENGQGARVADARIILKSCN